jgi:uncharacterized protein (DUF2235 family)
MNQSLPETRAPSAGAPGEVDRQQAPAQASREAKDGRRQHADGSKAIVLFSDGTGNSSAKLFKTNVWRMYEAVDLGPSSEEKRPQIAFYDNGVGTSALRPLAALGGIFGFGLKRNILEIYRYACRNYQAGPDQKPGADPVKGGDEIYGFGFSRGAFTMRLVIALIASQGLVVSSDEAELERKSKDAYRAFRADFEPRKLKWPTRLFRAAREWLSSKWRRRRGVPLYDSADNLRPEIRFVGVFDTVAAYGGPVTEITRAIDNWLYALSMPDYQLNERVRCARHALAIDDERDAFHPLLWDEVHEASLISDAKVSKDRLRQVWFTGMHADVGGGYPDESLSYVSLLWMIKEAEDQGLRVLKVITDRFLALASSSGPIHDSRSGPGAYYRYQPRKIAAWMQPPDPSTLYQRDPDRVDPNGASLGFIPTVLVHESVAARIAHGTDRYAPITLPARIVIVPPKAGGETALQADTVTPKAEAAADDGAVRPLLDPWLHDRFENAAFGAERVAKMERVWDLVWRRRIAYFLTLGLTLLLVLLPLWVSRTRDPPFLADGRTWLGEIIRLLNIILPQFLEGWVNTAAANSFYVLVLGVLILAIMGRSAAMEGQLRDHARAIWAHSLSPDRREPEVQKSAWRLRTSPHYQWWMQKAKWLVLPALFGLVMLGLLLWVALGLLTQTRLPGLERSGLLCPKRSSVAGTNAASLDFSPRSVCEAALMNVVRGERYLVTLDVVEPWKDSKVDAAPTGLAAGELGFPWGYIGVPLRRIVNAGYLQPAYLIRSRRAWWQFGEPVYIQPISLQQQGDAATSWQAEFTAERDGELSLFANDSILPFELGRYNYRYFYEQSGSGRGNSGSACVTIMRADRISLPPPPRTPACLLAAQRAAAAAKAELQPTRSASPRRPAARPAGARPPE